MKILFASQNEHKAAEYRAMLPSGFSLLSLADIQWTEEIPEPYATFKDNSFAKAQYVFLKTGSPCFADDSGLEINGLAGRPGVLSARYSGPHGNAEANMQKVLSEMKEKRDRTARFIAVITYIDAKGKPHFFEGFLEGMIATEKAGQKGFGYDPIFIPAGFDKTLGELDANIKNTISHRAKAALQFAAYLRQVLS